VPWCCTGAERPAHGRRSSMPRLVGRKTRRLGSARSERARRNARCEYGTDLRAFALTQAWPRRTCRRGGLPFAIPQTAGVVTNRAPPRPDPARRAQMAGDAQRPPAASNAAIAASPSRKHFEALSTTVWRPSVFVAQSRSWARWVEGSEGHWEKQTCKQRKAQLKQTSILKHRENFTAAL